MRPAEPREQARTSPLLVAASIVVIVAGMRAAAPLLQPLLLALFLAVLSLPIFDWLKRRGVGSGVAVAAAVFAAIAVLIAFGFAISATVNGFARAAPGYLEQLSGQVSRTLDLLRARGITPPEWVTVQPIDSRQLVDLLGGLVSGTVRGVASAVSYITVVVVAVIFVLFEMVRLPAKLAQAAGGKVEVARHWSGISREIQRYLGVKTVVSVLVGVCAGVWVAVLGVDFALLWGLLAFLLHYIPVLGAILASIPPVLLSLIQLGLGRAAVVALGFLLINFFIGNLLEPHLMGRKFGLSALVVFLAVVFWGWVLGPLGMILSVPMTMAMKIALEHSRHYAWLAVLLGPGGAAARREPQPEPEA